MFIGTPKTGCGAGCRKQKGVLAISIVAPPPDVVAVKGQRFWALRYSMLWLVMPFALWLLRGRKHPQRIAAADK